MGCFPGRRSRRRLPIAARELEVVGGKTRLPLTSICRAFMAEPETATLAVASLPSSDELERAASFTREPFLLEGGGPAGAPAPGAPRGGPGGPAPARRRGRGPRGGGAPGGGGGGGPARPARVGVGPEGGG